MNAQRRAYFHHLAVVESRGECSDGLNARFCPQSLNTREKQLSAEAKALRNLGRQFGIGLYNSNEQNIPSPKQYGQKFSDMVVNQSDDTQMNR